MMALGVQMGGSECAVHRHRELVPMETHHVWPLGEGGPDIPANKVRICMNAHGSVHSYLDMLLRRQRRGETGKIDWKIRRQYGRKTRALAELGFQRIQNQAI